MKGKGVFMNPISNQMFGYDFDRFVLQNPQMQINNPNVEIKPFNLNEPKKSEKSKKDLKKEKEKKKKEDNNSV